MNEQDWKAIGNQAKKVREELLNLHRMTTGKMPVAIVNQIHKAMNNVDKFKSVAEDRMFKTGGPESINIFYGTNDENNIEKK